MCLTLRLPVPKHVIPQAIWWEEGGSLSRRTQRVMGLVLSFTDLKGRRAVYFMPSKR